jgi:chitin synthase
VAQTGNQWTLHYCKNALASTDVPNTLVDLMKQRRRWTNGSFFATVYALYNFSRIITHSGHSCCAKFIFTLQFIYNVFCTGLAWFMPGAMR